MSHEEFDEDAGRFRVLGRGSLASLVAFRHREGRTHRDPPEEQFDRSSLIFTMSGSWGLTTSSGFVLADADTLVVAREGMTFRASHDARKPLDTAVCIDFCGTSRSGPGGYAHTSDTEAAWDLAFDQPCAPITAEIDRIRRALMWEAAQCPPAFALKLDGLVVELVAEVARTRSEGHDLKAAQGRMSARLRPDLRERMVAVRDYIEEHLAEDIDLDTLGRVVALSPFYLSRLFRREFGQAPHAYLARSRLEAAAGLLIHTSLSVTQIADRVGWMSASHLTARFRRHFGVTPTRYRHLAGH
jgi:AraC-like DNA-binding protein